MTSPELTARDGWEREKSPVRAALGRLPRYASWVLYAVTPAMALVYVFAHILAPGIQVPDFSEVFYPSAKALLHGRDFYPSGAFHPERGYVLEYVYPPLTAIVSVPFTVLPVGVGEVLFIAILTLAVPATLVALDVRDWRCYGLAFLWAPVLHAILTGNITLLVGLAAALVWRWRDRPYAAGVSLGLALAAKLYLWPLLPWLLVTRRVRATFASVVIGAAVFFLSWALVGFRGLADYPGLLHRLSDALDSRSYTVYALGLDVGLPSGVSRALWILFAVALLAVTVAVARRGDERSAFVLALAASLACTPIVWLHYFSLLLVAVAVASPRIGTAWFPCALMTLFVSTGDFNGSTFQNAAVFGLAAATIVLALARPEPRLRRARLSPAPRAGSP
jgi:alpha-1,2-mannosyltransferase